MNSRLQTSRKISGFTLVEILVAVTVLGLMMVGVAQMMSSALTVTGGSYKHMDADTQARMVLDRMAYDISKITKRMDVDYYFQKNPGNDVMAFYSESGGYYPTSLTSSSQQSNTSLVGYMIDSNNQLVRLSKGLAWNGVSSTAASMVFNPLANVPTSPAYNIVNINTIVGNTNALWSGNVNGILASQNDPDVNNYQVIGDQVFRMEYCFLVQSAPSGVTSLTSTTTNTTTATTSYFYDYPWTTKPDTTPNALQNVTAIIVTIAVLDSQSRAAVSNTTLGTAASYLEDDTFSNSTPTKVTTSVTLPLNLWENDLAGTSSTGTGPAGLGLPQSVASQVRFYQRYCYLNHLQ